MKASWAALMFSGLPPQALSADACSARPYENDSAHGLRKRARSGVRRAPPQRPHARSYHSMHARNFSH